MGTTIPELSSGRLKSMNMASLIATHKAISEEILKRQPEGIRCPECDKIFQLSIVDGKRQQWSHKLGQHLELAHGYPDEDANLSCRSDRPLESNNGYSTRLVYD